MYFFRQADKIENGHDSYQNQKHHPARRGAPYIEVHKHLVVDVVYQRRSRVIGAARRHDADGLKHLEISDCHNDQHEKDLR